MRFSDLSYSSRRLTLSLMLSSTLALSACGGDEVATSEASVVDDAPTALPSPGSADEKAPVVNDFPTEKLAAILADQSEDTQARYGARHPARTLEFFDIQPGMTVVEALPEGGWYTRILRPYLGEAGTIIGADYSLEMYPLFDFYSAEELAAKAVWSETWPEEVAQWPGEGATAMAFNFGSLPAELHSSADRVLFIRALHNLASFEASGAYLSTAIDDSFQILKPGGVVGVVQHMGPESHSDAWADGSNGYLKKSAVVAAFEAAGFVFDGESDVNENPKDTPTEEEYVWRLSPTLEPVEDEALAAKYAAIGESSRMTLRFRKPVAL
ncbi:O-methyltransferase [Luminiphilus syltensis NOR5-1B]|uniref:O-methyltransferase n=1 Tax=Luminiphilus syltensis NOR5-1B TaxID=565045 RepID=B8KU36_9GAMM|nr:class I SAM-dependent methyltransferase [Luminiphilus syltensis]EED34887.1 O-methyltransferase [Luminiphilus syltensis NOR5-1B]